MGSKTLTQSALTKRLKKWCNKQAKKLQKSTRIATDNNGLITQLQLTPAHYQDCNQQRGKGKKSSLAKSHKKAQRKQLSSLLAKHLAKEDIQSLHKPTLKKQLKKAKHLFIAANDAKYAPIYAITPLKSTINVSHPALHPVKKSPCRSCPALRGKLCQCALKAMQKRQAS